MYAGVERDAWLQGAQIVTRWRGDRIGMKVQLKERTSGAAGETPRELSLPD